MADAPDFDPAKPYEAVAGNAPPPFDPSKPFEAVQPQPTFDERFNVSPNASIVGTKDVIPDSFIDRLYRGIQERDPLNAFIHGFGRAFVSDNSDVTPQQIRQHLQDAGLYGDPGTGRAGMAWIASEALGNLPWARVSSMIEKLTNSFVGGAGEAAATVSKDVGEPQGRQEAARNEIENFLNYSLMRGDHFEFTRLHDNGTGPQNQVIGNLPKDIDFANAAHVANDNAGLTEESLRRLWQDRGLHPAEVAHAAQNDALLRHDLKTGQGILDEQEAPGKTSNLSQAFGQSAQEAGEGTAPLRAVGADVSPPPETSIQEQPARPAGSLIASVKGAADKLYDIGRDLQMMTAPMATGTRDSMAVAKDFANSLRRNRWEWSRIDQDIADRFTPEQRERMWNAADEESVLRQEGKTSEHMGLATLEPEERQAVEDLQARAQLAWGRARDLGMVEGEGLPAYTPRLIINAASAAEKDGSIALNRLPGQIGRNLKTRTGQMLHRQYLTAEETEAAAKGALGEGAQIARDIRTLPLATAKLEDAIAGRTLINNIREVGARAGEETVADGFRPPDTEEHKWFTVDHPAFRTWRASGEDAEGNAIFNQVPLYVRDDFEGPLKAVLSHKSGAVYNALMAAKGKTMGLIMNSPLIHNAVEWGRAMPAMPGKVATFKIYFEGNRVKNDIGQMKEAIDAGLVPIGHRYFNQDISSIMEEPNLTPGRSWTAQIAGFVPGLFDPAAGTAVKAAIDKAGDFWHNTMLWDRVADLQAGLYANFRDELLAKGVDRSIATKAAAHWANRYAGALPQEAMSDGARKIANLLMFSRSFTMGNLGVMKDMLTGLPKDVIAQIERDAGFGAGSIERFEEGTEGAQEAVRYAKTMARRKAMSVVALDIGLMYVGNSLLQNAMNVMMGDATLDKEMHGYAMRFSKMLSDVHEHPLKLLQPFNLIQSLSATNENEPGRQDRIKIGYAKDGTAIYARNPVGKIGEEFTGYLSGPLDMFRRKLGTLARPAWQIMANDKGFGRKVYDPNADTLPKYMKNIGAIAAHIAGSQAPEGQISAGVDLVKGEGDSKVNALQALGPIAGVTFSKGAPGGPAVGELYHAREVHQYAVDNALPDIRRQIQRGDIAGAKAAMNELHIPAGLQKFYLRTTLNPATRLSGRTLRDFYQYATPEQRQRLESVR